MGRSDVLQLALLFMICIGATAPAACLAAPVERPKISQIQRAEPVTFGDAIVFELKDANGFLQQPEFDAAKLTLYLDNQQVHGLTALLGASAVPTISFVLKPDDSNLADVDREVLRQDWRHVLGSPKSVMRLKIQVNYDGVPLQFVADGDSIVYFRVYNKWILMVAIVCLISSVAAFCYLAFKSDILRDSVPTDLPPGQRRPFSLARTQMAVWTLLVVGAFVFIYLVTQNYRTVTEEAFILIGISAATALGAALVDSRKSGTTEGQLDELAAARTKVEAEFNEAKARIDDIEKQIKNFSLQAGQAAFDAAQEQLRQQMSVMEQRGAELKRVMTKIATGQSYLSTPVSQGFVRDLLSDKEGITLHRTQIVLWTAVLGIVFMWEVWNHLAMPAFGTELLALTGISSATYLGYKLPEQQAS